MRVSQRKGARSSGMLPISVPEKDIESTNQALEVLEKKYPHSVMSKVLIGIIKVEAARLSRKHAEVEA